MLETAADLIDMLAFLVLLGGLLLSVRLAWASFHAASGPWAERLAGPALTRFRVSLGRWMLTGLEILIVSDILHSVVHRTLEEVGMLAVIVVIRVAMAYFLDMEIRGIEDHERRP